MDNGILHLGLTAKLQIKHIFTLLLLVLICSDSSRHKFQRITKEKVNRVVKPLGMFIWGIKKGEKLQQQGKVSIKKLTSAIQNPLRSHSKCFSLWDKGASRQGMALIPDKKRSCFLGRRTIQVKCGNFFLWSEGKNVTRTGLAAEGTHSPPAAQRSSRSSERLWKAGTSPSPFYFTTFFTQVSRLAPCKSSGICAGSSQCPESPPGQGPFSLLLLSHFIFSPPISAGWHQRSSHRQKRGSESLKGANKPRNSTRSPDRQCCKLSWKRPSYCTIIWFPLL